MAPSAEPGPGDGLATAMVEARSSGTPTVMPPVEAAPGIWMFRVAAPIPGGGLLVASHSINAMLDPMYERSLFALRLMAGETSVYSKGQFAAHVNGAEASIELPGTTWRVRLAPTPELAANQENYLPMFVLVFGCLLAGSLGCAVHMARSSADAARREKGSNATLATEIAERTRIESALRDTMAVQRAILDSASYIILSLDGDGRVRTFNQAAERLLGRTADQMIGQDAAQLIHNDELVRRAHDLSGELDAPVEAGIPALVSRVQPGQPETREWTFVHSDGTGFPVELSVCAMANAAGQVDGYVLIAADISRRRQADQLRGWAEESLRRTEELLHSVLDSATNGVIAARSIRNEQGEIQDFEVLLLNPAAERIFQKSASYLVGRGLREEVESGAGGDIFRMCADVVETRLPADVERHYARDGLEGWFRLIVAPLGDGVAMSVEDVTRRKLAEEEIALYVADLEKSRDQIHEQSVVLQWQAEALTHARDEALAGTREMERALKMQADFVSFASHQLRTPLAGIKWLLELALEEPGLGDDLRSYMEDSLASADRLIGLVNDLLHIARLEGGRATLAPAGHDLSQLCLEVAEQLRPNLEKRQHSFHLAGVDAPVPVFVDASLMQQVVENLLSNAIKYTPDGGHVSLALEHTGAEVRCVIEDSGIGVPEGARPRLFEKFFRADNVQTMETEGTGLGLFMVRLILETLGGRIWHEARGIETGSRFVVVLPAKGNHVSEADSDRGGRPRAA